MNKKYTDTVWQKFGEENPFYGVLSDQKYSTENITEESKKQFFQSGYDYVEKLIEKIKKYIDPEFSAENTVDFGCGLGRLVIPLSKFSRHVTGIDVSDAMIKKAAEFCRTQSISNVSFVKSDDTLSRLTGEYDFIHSFIVFQHIPVKRGEIIFKSLLQHLKVGGVGVLHFTYAHDYKPKYVLNFIKEYIPLVSCLINYFKKRDLNAVAAEMNPYNINRLLIMLQKDHVSDIHLEYTDHGHELGVILFFKKDR
ncbi:MAG: class I SAM-dependent methyltransferase [Clostridia bacterium]|nr:class I SAM-dependent methyltransferase [Clostridia bacterium]